MKGNEVEEKNKIFNSTIKSKLIKGYQKLRNKTNNNYYIQKDKENINYFHTFEKSSNNLNDESYNSLQDNKNQLKINYFNLKNLKIEHLSKVKKDDYNHTLNKLFFTTSNLMKHRKEKRKFQKDSLINSYYNLNTNDDINGKNKILNKLFPDINEMNKFSNLPFFSFTKRRTPYQNKFNLSNKYKIRKEEFLYKISHEDNSKEKYILNKNKGIKKGTTTQYFHGVDKFCINNKITKNNYPLSETIKKRKLNLELDVENITKGGEKTSQLSNKEKRLKLLKNNIQKIKSLPNQLFNDLEEDVFKFLDEEFEKNHNSEKDIKDNKDNKETKKEEENKNNRDKVEKNIMTEGKYFINNLNINLLPNNSANTNISENNENNNYINPTTFKKLFKYPINFYTTQQLKKKEHFPINCKITFEERIKMLKKEKEKEEEENLKKINYRLPLENRHDLKEKRKLSNKYKYKKQSKIRDILIGNKLKKTYDEIDTKRILNGLKPWVLIKADEKKEIDIDILKRQLNEDIKNIL